ncbi:class I SAM-dependent methyltransferase [Helicobacter sp.]|uniref:class I SAM-dependent methyltransferase n=1 Tax=Helicobacter sp. TaxID=218 RepID=UPI0025C31E1D|nr:class I SAM-dependent methyltransferase [Helicobacter sp.]
MCPKDGFSYLELAFGCGGSINIHAATTNGEYVGTDFNPSQVAIAKSYVQSANIILYEDSFKQLLECFEKEQPQFDYIVFHGIFSWISQENRNIILEIIRRFLKVGGVVYNSYNCMPGWSPKSPTRELLGLYKELNHSAEIDTQGLVKNTLAFFESFLETKPFYAEHSPQNKQMLEHLKSRDFTYVSHEYFNQNWDCFYFYQVAKMMEEAKCSFATEGKFLHYFDGYNFNADAIAFLSKIQNRIFKEQLKDYYLNQQFRRDIYIKGARRISQREAKERLSKTYFTLLMPITHFQEKMQFPLGEANLQKDLYQGVLKFLEKDNYKAKSLEEIMEACKIDFLLASQVIFILAEQAMVLPVQPVSKELQERARAYNLGVLKKQGFSAESSLFIAAPRIASGILVSNVEQIVMRAYLQGSKKETEFVNYVMRAFKENNQGFMKDGKVLESEAENKAAIKEVVKEFLEKVPIYKVLGILE